MMINKEIIVIKKIEKEDIKKMNCKLAYIQGVIMGNGGFVINGAELFLNNATFFEEVN